MLNLAKRFDFSGQTVAWGCMGEGKPLVLIHGTPFSSQVWRKIAPLLSQRWKVYYFDLLGYGLSEKKQQQNVALDVQNKLLCTLLKEWQLDRPEFLCHDFGGATVLRAYYLNQLRFSKLTLIDPVALAPWGSPFITHVREHQAAFTGLPEYAHNALLRAYLQSAAYQPLSEQALQVYMQPWQGEIGQAAFYRQIAQMDQKFTDQIEPSYDAMDGQVRILWGKEDQWIPLSQGQKLASLLAQGELTIVSGSGHLMQEDAPESIIAAMYN